MRGLTGRGVSKKLTADPRSGGLAGFRSRPVDHDNPYIDQDERGNQEKPERYHLDPHSVERERILLGVPGRLFGDGLLWRRPGILRNSYAGAIEIVHEPFFHVETRHKGQSEERETDPDDY